MVYIHCGHSFCKNYMKIIPLQSLSKKTKEDLKDFEWEMADRVL